MSKVGTFDASETNETVGKPYELNYLQANRKRRIQRFVKSVKTIQTKNTKTINFHGNSMIFGKSIYNVLIITTIFY